MVHTTVALTKRRFHGLMRPMRLKSSVRMSRKAASSKWIDAESVLRLSLNSTKFKTCPKGNMK